MQLHHFALFCGLLAPLVLGSPVGHEVDKRIVERLHNQLDGADVCSRGPSYWCHNITTANNCNAVNHCIRTEWTQDVVPEAKGILCTICMLILEEFAFFCKLLVCDAVAPNGVLGKTASQQPSILEQLQLEIDSLSKVGQIPVQVDDAHQDALNAKVTDLHRRTLKKAHKFA